MHCVGHGYRYLLELEPGLAGWAGDVLEEVDELALLGNCGLQPRFLGNKSMFTFIKTTNLV